MQRITRFCVQLVTIRSVAVGNLGHISFVISAIHSLLVHALIQGFWIKKSGPFNMAAAEPLFSKRLDVPGVPSSGLHAFASTPSLLILDLVLKGLPRVSSPSSTLHTHLQCMYEGTSTHLYYRVIEFGFSTTAEASKYVRALKAVISDMTRLVTTALNDCFTKSYVEKAFGELYYFSPLMQMMSTASCTVVLVEHQTFLRYI